MAEEAVRDVVVISIHPEHAHAILNGEKTVEFRKRGFRRPVSHVLLYATAPTRRLVGCFSISEVDQGAPTAIWAKHGRRGAVPRSLFRDYYRGSRAAVAIVVDKALAFDNPIPLTDLIPSGYTPQSFAYVCLRGRPEVAGMIGALGAVQA